MKAMKVTYFTYVIALSIFTLGLVSFGANSKSITQGQCYHFDNSIVEVVAVENDGVVWELIYPLKKRNNFNLWFTSKVEFERRASLSTCDAKAGK